jgi:hypothetical protein
VDGIVGQPGGTIAGDFAGRRRCGYVADGQLISIDVRIDGFSCQIDQLVIERPGQPVILFLNAARAMRRGVCGL